MGRATRRAAACAVAVLLAAWSPVVLRQRRDDHPDRPHRARDQRRWPRHRRHRRRTGEPGHPLQDRQSERRQPARDRCRLPERHRERAAPREVPGCRPAQRQPLRRRVRRDDGPCRLRGRLRHPTGRRLHLCPPGRRSELGAEPRLHRQPRRRPGAGHHDRPRYPFSYLKGSVPFEDNDPNIGESYGYLATPLAGADFKPLVEAPIPGTTEKGSLVGEYTHDGRKELVVTFVYNQYQQQYRLLARGIVDWVTQGIHLGYDRNYFAAHVDDVFLADDRWDTSLKCTPGDVTCPPGTPESSNPIRMT